MLVNRDWVIRTYDRIVADLGETGGASKEVADALANAYEKAISTGELERPTTSAYDEGLTLYTTMVKPERNARRAKIVKEMEYLVAALNDETILGSSDPRLDQAVGLGEANGRDKTLRLWTSADWRGSAMTRYRNAAEATAAAAKYDALATQIADEMDERHVRHTGDLYTP